MMRKEGLQMKDTYIDMHKPDIRSNTRSKQQMATKIHYKKKNQSNPVKHSGTGHVKNTARMSTTHQLQ
jgi:hypothetical protein